MLYTDKTAIENYLLITIDETFDTQIDEWIEAMSRYMDRLANRKLVADSIEDSDADEGATEKVFDGNGEDVLLVDDFVSLTSVRYFDSEDVVDDTTYVSYPANKVPQNKIKMRYGGFYRGDQNVIVKARWGYFAELPEDIKFICTVMVAGIVNTQIGSEGEVQSETIGKYSVTYRSKKELNDYEEALKLIKAYRKY